jgi:alkylation response protein AidB-like acyl-CoA dehydrogenase
MAAYTPQTEDLKHTLDDIAGLPELIDAGVFPELSGDLVDQVLSEAGRFAAEVIAPLNRSGDTHGCRFDPQAHAVTTAPGWKEAYGQWVEAGWGALPCPPEIGGQGLPILVSLAVQELWNTAASAFGIGTLLTQGAVDALSAHGSDDLKHRYLPNMASGRWTGTMVLTEPQAGSDLGAVRTRAERRDDGSYAVTGTKIFITYGEHDLTENIVHSVLARIVGAPDGTKGLSLFLVPKFLAEADGALGARNDVKCIGLEEKLGIHGSPTCTMRFGDEDGATGFLVGEENKGLACMFTMMNNARLHVGMQGVAVAERATQGAIAYARERRQGARPGSKSAPIIEHPDIRRMLLDMKARTAAARAVCFETARALDLARYGREDEERRANGDLAALLTPVAKAFSTDIGTAVASLGIQVHGGMGYIEETGAAQHLRDARICQIYEGTNGVQAIDLVTRKLALAGGQAVWAYTGKIRAEAEAMAQSDDEDAAAIGVRLRQASSALEEATDTLQGWLKDGGDRPLASATPYLRLFGLTAGAAGLARGARAAMARRAGANDDRHIRLARYFADNHLPFTGALKTIVERGPDSLLATTPDMLAV